MSVLSMMTKPVTVSENDDDGSDVDENDYQDFPLDEGDVS